MHATTSRTTRARTFAGTLLVLFAAVAGCGAPEDSSNGSGAPPPDVPSPTALPPPAGTPPPVGEPDRSPGPGLENPFEDADLRMRQMVQSRAQWHAPSRTPVDQTAEIGLSIGDGEELRAEIEEALPDTPSRPGVPLKVGTDVSARLIGDDSDVSITPDDSIDASTGSDIALLWTWKIHPQRPTDRLELTALLKMTVPGTNHQLTKILDLDLVVVRTFSFTVHQVFTNWGTWTAIISSAAAAAGWLWARRRRKKRPPPTHDRAGPRRPRQPTPKPARPHHGRSHTGASGAGARK